MASAIVSLFHLTCVTVAVLGATVNDPDCPATGSDTFRPNPPRVFPICIGKDPESDQWDNKIKETGFDRVLDDIASKLDQGGNYDGFIYDSEKHYLIQPMYDTQVPQDGTSRVQDFQITGMVNCAHPDTSELDNYRCKIQVKLMTNWMYLLFHGLFMDNGKKYPVKGIYIQGIHGPLGIPFGDFITLDTDGEVINLPDWDSRNKAKMLYSYADHKFFTTSLSYPCTYYSKAGPTIPNVYIWSSLLGGRDFQDYTFHLAFRFWESFCAEVAFLQFIIVIVFDWGVGGGTIHYRAALSPVVKPGKYIQGLGRGIKHFTTYPFYPDWSFLNYGFPWAQNLLDNSVDYEKLRIVPNLEYEHCVQHGIGLTRRGPQKGACPPGPFKCKPRNVPTQVILDDKGLEWLRWKSIYKKYNPAREVCMMPTTTTTTTTTTTPTTTTTEEPTTPNTTTTTTTKRPPTAVEEKEQEVIQVAKKEEKKKQISHGDLCVLVWFVLVPVANYISRFFKDFHNFERCGLGFWIIGHVMLHHIGIFFMWISFGLVVSNGASFLGGASRTHYIFGFPVTVIQHYTLFTGGYRSQRVQRALHQSAVHVALGYISGFLGWFTNINMIKWIIVCTLFGGNIAISMVGNWVEWRISKRLGMFPPRKFFPVLERVVMINASPRSKKLKIFMFTSYIVVIAAVYAFYFWHEELFKRILGSSYKII